MSVLQRHVFTVKSEELQKDVEIMSNTFERRVDRKDAIIRSLAKDLEEAEEQYVTHVCALTLLPVRHHCPQISSGPSHPSEKH